VDDKGSLRAWAPAAKRDGMLVGTKMQTSVFARLKAVMGRQTHSELCRDMAVIAGSGLFEASSYLINAQDVWDAKADPLTHFCRHGWREGRRPNLYFDPAWYIATYMSTAQAGLNPLVHYIREGEAKGFMPIYFFDPSWYRTAYAVPAATLALAHYLAHRRAGRFAPNPHFDIAFYRARFGSEVGPNRDVFMHFIRSSLAGDRDPSERFGSSAYRATAMGDEEPARVGLATQELRVPLLHYLHGLHARRPSAEGAD
jgi:hypothetical protein